MSILDFFLMWVVRNLSSEITTILIFLGYNLITIKMYFSKTLMKNPTWMF